MTDADLRCAHCRQPLTEGQAFCSHCGAAASARAPTSESLKDQLQDLLGADVVVDAEIGRGAMGAVFAGLDVELQRRVAIKTLLPAAESDPGIAERFIREARVAASLDHPNVVSIYAVRQGAGIRAIVMQRIDGRGLEKLLWETPLLPIPVAAHILAQVSAALQHAHDRGVVHRDVKPANILIGDDGHAIVTDFGIARKLGSTRITEEGLVVGTLGYLSPEACGGLDATPQSDQYSLGVTAFELFAGRRPFSGTPMELLRLHSIGDAPSLAESRPDLPPALAKTVQRMLAREPADRLRTLHDAERVFRSFVPEPSKVTRELSVLSTRVRTAAMVVKAQTAGGIRRAPAEPQPAPPATVARGSAAETRARRWRAATIGAATFVVLAFPGALLWNGRGRDPAADARAETAETPPTPVFPGNDPPQTTAPVILQTARPEPGNELVAPTTPAATIDSVNRAADLRTLPPRDTVPPVTSAGRSEAIVVPPVRRESVTTPALPSASAIDARRIGNAFVTLINQGRWSELDALARIGGDSAVREDFIRIVRTTRNLAAGFDRLPSAPMAAAGGFDTEFIVDLALGNDTRAEHAFVVIRARAAREGNAWVLAGWRVERAP